MNIYEETAGLDGPRPKGLKSENWCNRCEQVIKSEKNKWGRREHIGSGGLYLILPYGEDEEVSPVEP